MELRWVHYNSLGDPAHSRLVDGDIGTNYVLYCDKHWDTGAPDEWIVRKGGCETPFPSQAEAKNYAEATYILEEANNGA